MTFSLEFVSMVYMEVIGDISICAHRNESMWRSVQSSSWMRSTPPREKSWELMITCVTKRRAMTHRPRFAKRCEKMCKYSDCALAIDRLLRACPIILPASGKDTLRLIGAFAGFSYGSFACLRARSRRLMTFGPGKEAGKAIDLSCKEVNTCHTWWWGKL